MSYLVLGFCSLVFAVMARRLVRRRPQRCWPCVKGGLWYLGNLLQLRSPERMVEQMMLWADEYADEKGVYEFSLLGKRYVVATQHDAIQPILRERPFKIQRDSGLRAAANSLWSGVFSAEGDTWRAERREILPGLSSHKRLGMYMPSVKLMARRLVGKWRADAAGGGAVAINDDLRNTMMDLTSLVLMGHDMDALRSEEATDFQAALDGIFRLTMTRALAPVPYYKIPLIGPHLDGGGALVARVHGLIRGIIDEHRAKAARGAAEATVLAKILESSRIADDRIMGNLTTLFLGGTDTTSIAVAWMLWELARDPALQSEAAEQAAAIDLEPGSETSPKELLASAPLLVSLFYEALHIHGPAPYAMHENVEPFVLTAADGTTAEVAPRSCVLITLSRHKDTRADAVDHGVPAGRAGPATFDARRWLLPGGAGVVKPGRDSFLAFGHGRRLCPGKDLARLEAVATVAAVLQAFSFRPEAGHPEVRDKTVLTQAPDRDMRLNFRPRAPAPTAAVPSRAHAASAVAAAPPRTTPTRGEPSSDRPEAWLAQPPLPTEAQRVAAAQEPEPVPPPRAEKKSAVHRKSAVVVVAHAPATSRRTSITSSAA